MGAVKQHFSEFVEGGHFGVWEEAYHSQCGWSHGHVVAAVLTSMVLAGSPLLCSTTCHARGSWLEAYCGKLMNSTDPDEQELARDLQAVLWHLFLGHLIFQLFHLLNIFFSTTSKFCHVVHFGINKVPCLDVCGGRKPPAERLGDGRVFLGSRGGISLETVWLAVFFIAFKMKAFLYSIGKPNGRIVF